MRLAAALVMLATAALQSPAWLTPAAPTVVCTVERGAAELSGLVATASGYVAINDSQFDPDDTRVFFLNHNCDITRTVRYPTPARDPEDLAVAPDGSLWVADIGDNITASERRRSIALWKLPAGAGAPVIHRLTYPDGPHDAEALLFTNDGAPVVITKEPSGRAGLYQPTGPLRARTTAGVPLRRVGEFTPNGPSETGLLGAMVTGAATSPNRSRIVLRTYTAAYEWDVRDGDIIKTMTTGTPRVTALPDETQGEAIAYTPDGTAFLTVSDESGPTTLRRYLPGTESAPRGTATSSHPPAASRPNAPAPTWLASIPVPYGVAAALVGLILAVAGLIGVRRNQRRRSTYR